VALAEYNAELDLAVEEVIEACLRQDPAIRIKSALTVFQMLPGNSPLEAALAMGQTPSPEQVAASVEQPLLSARVIGTLLIAAVKPHGAGALWTGAPSKAVAEAMGKASDVCRQWMGHWPGFVDPVALQLLDITRCFGAGSVAPTGSRLDSSLAAISEWYVSELDVECCGQPRNSGRGWLGGAIA